MNSAVVIKHLDYFLYKVQNIFLAESICYALSSGVRLQNSSRLFKASFLCMLLVLLPLAKQYWNKKPSQLAIGNNLQDKYAYAIEPYKLGRDFCWLFVWNYSVEQKRLYAEVSVVKSVSKLSLHCASHCACVLSKRFQCTVFFTRVSLVFCFYWLVLVAVTITFWRREAIACC